MKLNHTVFSVSLRIINMLQLQKLKEAQYGKDGQIKILRENLNRKDSEISRLKQDRLEEISRQARERSQKEQELEREVERLSTQLTFKEKEIGEIQGLYKKMERQLKSGIVASSPGELCGKGLSVCEQTAAETTSACCLNVYL